MTPPGLFKRRNLLIRILSGILRVPILSDNKSWRYTLCCHNLLIKSLNKIKNLIFLKKCFILNKRDKKIKNEKCCTYNQQHILLKVLDTIWQRRHMI